VKSRDGDIVELVPERLYVLGGRLRLGSDISWAPPASWGRIQPINCYLLREGDAAMIIDPGLDCQADLVVDQLRSVLPPGSPLAVCITRPEFDTFGPLRKIAELYEIAELYAGGNNPFDSFDYVTSVSPTQQTDHIQLQRIQPGTAIPIAANRSITLIRPSIRVLVTYWIFDPMTETLFTSDAFGHATSADSSESRVAEDAAGCDADIVRAHLFAKFWWLGRAGAAIDIVDRDLAEIFDKYPISTIAPSRGRVIRGRDAVQQHYGLVREVFADIAKQAPVAAALTGRDAGSPA
jgi:flavorubredoxin